MAVRTRKSKAQSSNVEQLKKPLNEANMTPLSIWLPVLNAERINAANEIERLEVIIAEQAKSNLIREETGIPNLADRVVRLPARNEYEHEVLGRAANALRQYYDARK